LTPSGWVLRADASPETGAVTAAQTLAAEDSRALRESGTTEVVFEGYRSLRVRLEDVAFGAE
jgi:hypothetical protein